MFCFSKRKNTKVKVKTLAQNNNWDLFDYKSQNFSKVSHIVRQSSIVYKSKKDLSTQIIQKHLYSNNYKQNIQQQFIAQIKISQQGKNQNVAFQPLTLSNKQNHCSSAQTRLTKPYLVIKQFKQHSNKLGYPLKVGDVIKLGIISLKVEQINKNKFESDSLYLSNRKTQSIELNVIDFIQKRCKFCLCDEQDAKNPIISPCKCKGSCCGVHILCLKKWVYNKAHRQIKGLVTSLNFSKINCQICKQQIPEQFIYKEKQFNLLSFENPKQIYLILQSVDSLNKIKSDKSIHIITPIEFKQISIGRGEQCDLKINDKSVSRVHCSIKFQDGQFYINDKQSRFGTLVQINNQIQLKQKFVIQAGTTIYQITPP